jgi:hypothetical protein
MRLTRVIERDQARDLACALSPLEYVRSLGFDPFDWQESVLSSRHKRKEINGARQSGKSTVIQGIPCWIGKYTPRSLSIIAASTEKQAVEDMEKVKDFIARDPRYPKIVRDSDSLLELDNGSRILIVPATEKAARGYSSPDAIILDEAAWILDPVYRSGIRPMLTDNEKCELIIISTPNGRGGFFYRAWYSDRWEKYEIKSPWVPDENDWTLSPGIPEKEYQRLRAEQGIRAWYSPRHRNLEEQQESLEEIGPRDYLQNYCCEFIEPEGQVFKYNEITNLFTSDVKPMELGAVEETDDVAPLEVNR